jgi:beta-glucosidase
MRFSFILLFIFNSIITNTLAQPLSDGQQLNQSIDSIIIKKIIPNLSLSEKTSLLLYNSPAIPGLNIPAYNWWNESLHGIARAGKATVFPQSTGLAATFDDSLVFRVASVISTEARAKNNEARKRGNLNQYMGLTFWSPNLNIFRDPRWGRGQETYGEDPLLTSRIGTAYIRGIQGDHPVFLKAAACAKHFAVHSGPEESRHHFNALPDDRDFREVYLPAFKAATDARVEAVMCAYNRLYDLPCCGNPFLLKEILRNEWGFSGHIVSDCWALDDFWLRHKIVADQIAAAALAAEAGVNINCGYIYQYLPEAVKTGLISEQTIDTLLLPALRTRFRLGLLGNDENNPWNGLDDDTVNCSSHQQLAFEAASKSIVLLKNNGILPLDTGKLKSLFLTGPAATSSEALLGNYHGLSGQISTFTEGIISLLNAGITVDITQGCLFDGDTVFNGFWQASMAEITIAFMGFTSQMEGERGDAILNKTGGDRLSTALPANQLLFLKRLKENLKGKPLIVVISGGGSVDLEEVDKLADALLFAWYPGEQGGNALASILFGLISPSGKLPVTFYRSVSYLPPFDDYSMQGRTYRYFKGQVMYPFGYGISYSHFEISLSDDQKVISPDGLIRLKVTNKGNHDGEEVIQLYLSKSNPIKVRYEKVLADYQRLYLKKGSSAVIELKPDWQPAKYWDTQSGKYILEEGQYTITVGNSSTDQSVCQKIIIRDSQKF